MFGGSGCLGAGGSSPGDVDIVSVNRTAVGHDVSVRVRDANGRDVLREAFRLGAGDIHADPDALPGRELTATVSLAGNPFSEAERTFDLRDCATPRIVVVIRPGPRVDVERERADC